MRRAWISAVSLVLFLALPRTGHTQDAAATPNDTSRFLTATFPAGKKVDIELKPTSRLPDADGKAEVENQENMTRIKVKLDDMKPAVLFGGDFNTYVLWLITPEGQVQNLGEFLLDDDQAELKTTTPLSSFGLFVSAEPHFLVDFPSRMIVLEMGEPDDDRLRDFRIAELRYEGVKGMYDFTRETLEAAPEIKRDVAFDVAQARTAVRLAERSGAREFAAVELRAARRALQKAEEALATEEDAGNRIGLGREAVRLAVRAQTIAQERLAEAQLEEERERASRELERLRSALARVQSEAERARLEAEQQRLETGLEQRARERAQQRIEELRTDAQEQARNAEEQAERMRSEERGRPQGVSEDRQAFEQAQESARAAEQRYQELSLEQQRLEQMVLEAERSLSQAEQNQQNLQNRQPRTEGDIATAQQQVERARALLEQARQQAELSRQRAQEAEEEAGHAKQLAAQRQQELQSERQAQQQTGQQLSQLQTEQTRTREQLREALGQVAETRETVEGLVVNVPDILFEFDSASLKPQAREVLRKVAQTLRIAGRYRLTIEGHTDSVGRPEYNRELSQARAQAVKDFLVQSGLDSSLIVEVRGLGEKEPRASNDTADGRQENRRVEILVQEPPAPARAE
ncbi:MAG: OmpA family protein [Acidobacteriota bacterium]